MLLSSRQISLADQTNVGASRCDRIFSVPPVSDPPRISIANSETPQLGSGDGGESLRGDVDVDLGVCVEGEHFTVEL